MTPPAAAADQATNVMNKPSDELVKTILQVLAILGLLAICLIILHKGYADVAALARLHPGEGFWGALARYVLRNIAG
jgi:hypothetical protein